MRAKFVNEGLYNSGDNYLDSMYRELADLEELLADANPAQQPGIAREISDLKQKIEWEEIDQQEMEEYQAQQRGEDPYQ